MIKSWEKVVRKSVHEFEKNKLRPFFQEIKKLVTTESALAQQTEALQEHSSSMSTSTSLFTIENNLSYLETNDTSEEFGIFVELNLFQCIITSEILQDPVTAADGHTYERTALQSYYDSGRKKCPLDLEKPLVNPEKMPTDKAIKKSLEEIQSQRQNPKLTNTFNTFFNSPSISAGEKSEATIFTVTKRLFQCPITSKLMTDPIVAEDGETYNRDALQNHYDKKGPYCPSDNNIPLSNPNNLSTSHIMKQCLSKFNVSTKYSNR